MFLVLLGGAGLPSLGPASVISGHQDHRQQGKTAQNRLKGAKLNYFLRCVGVSSGISETKKGKSKSIFEIEGQKVGKLWASVAAFLGGSWELPLGFRSDSPPT